MIIITTQLMVCSIEREILQLVEADSNTEQTFGVDLEARARADRKRVPIVVTTILTFLDNRTSHP